MTIQKESAVITRPSQVIELQRMHFDALNSLGHAVRLDRPSGIGRRDPELPDHVLGAVMLVKLDREGARRVTDDRSRYLEDGVAGFTGTLLDGPTCLRLAINRARNVPMRLRVSSRGVY